MKKYYINSIGPLLFGILFIICFFFLFGDESFAIYVILIMLFLLIMTICLSGKREIPSRTEGEVGKTKSFFKWIAIAIFIWIPLFALFILIKIILNFSHIQINIEFQVKAIIYSVISSVIATIIISSYFKNREETELGLMYLGWANFSKIASSLEDVKDRLSNITHIQTKEARQSGFAIILILLITNSLFALVRTEKIYFGDDYMWIKSNSLPNDQAILGITNRQVMIPQEGISINEGILGYRNFLDINLLLGCKKGNYNSNFNHIQFSFMLSGRNISYSHDIFEPSHNLTVRLQLDIGTREITNLEMQGIVNASFNNTIEEYFILFPFEYKLRINDPIYLKIDYIYWLFETLIVVIIYIIIRKRIYRRNEQETDKIRQKIMKKVSE